MTKNRLKRVMELIVSLSLRIVKPVVKFFLKPIVLLAIKILTIRNGRLYRDAYNNWAIVNNDACFVDAKLKNNPKMSIIVPAYNTKQNHLKEMVYSVVNQHYENWELIIINASTEAEIIDYTNDLQNIDTRIKVINAKNEGISKNTNLGIKNAAGKYIVFLDHDDLLHPCALHVFVERINISDAGIVYSDEDKVNDEGSYHFGPHFKPDWSLYLLENVNYTNHLSAIKTDLVKGVGMLRKECDGAQDYDLLLRVIDKYSPVIEHIPRILYYWRAAESSTASDISNKTYIFKAGERALNDHFKTAKISATTKTINGKPGFYKTNYDKPLGITIVVDSVGVRYKAASVNWLLKLIAVIKDEKIQLVLPSYFSEYGVDNYHKNILYIDVEQTYADNLDSIINVTKNDVVIFLNCAATPVSKEHLYDLAAVAKNSGATAVQPMIIDRDNRIKDAGYVHADIGLRPLFRGLEFGANTVFGNTDWVRNIATVSGFIVALKRETLTKVTVSKNQNSLTEVLPGDGIYLLWSHARFIWESPLNYIDNKQPTFNPSLDDAHKNIWVKNSTWNTEMGRVHE